PWSTTARASPPSAPRNRKTDWSPSSTTTNTSAPPPIAATNSAASGSRWWASSTATRRRDRNTSRSPGSAPSASSAAPTSSAALSASGMPDSPPRNPERSAICSSCRRKNPADASHAGRPADCPSRASPRGPIPRSSDRSSRSRSSRANPTVDRAGRSRSGQSGAPSAASPRRVSRITASCSAPVRRRGGGASARAAASRRTACAREWTVRTGASVPTTYSGPSPAVTSSSRAAPPVAEAVRTNTPSSPAPPVTADRTTSTSRAVLPLPGPPRTTQRSRSPGPVPPPAAGVQSRSRSPSSSPGHTRAPARAAAVRGPGIWSGRGVCVTARSDHTPETVPQAGASPQGVLEHQRSARGPRHDRHHDQHDGEEGQSRTESGAGEEHAEDGVTQARRRVADPLGEARQRGRARRGPGAQVYERQAEREGARPEPEQDDPHPGRDAGRPEQPGETDEVGQDGEDDDEIRVLDASGDPRHHQGPDQPDRRAPQAR